MIITAPRSPRLSAGGQSQRKDQYGPFHSGIRRGAALPGLPRSAGRRSRITESSPRKTSKRLSSDEDPDTVGALCIEPITAGGGVIPPPEGYMETVDEICKKYGVLIHIDEVVCGMGRTGTWFGYQHYGIKPDMVSMAKGVASGYAAISVLATTEALFQEFLAEPADQLHYFRDISTFGGCAGGPAAAVENMKIIEEENLLDNVVKQGDYCLERLQELMDKHEVIGQVRGKGLFLGAELVADRKTREPLDEGKVAAVAADCLKQGVMIGRTNRSLPGLNNTLCLSPGSAPRTTSTKSSPRWTTLSATFSCKLFPGALAPNPLQDGPEYRGHLSLTWCKKPASLDSLHSIRQSAI